MQTILMGKSRNVVGISPNTGNSVKKMGKIKINTFLKKEVIVY